VVVAEEQTPERAAEETPRKAVETGATALDIAGGVLGLVVFLVGVALVVATYRQASQWYKEIGPEVEAARVGSQDAAQESGSDSGDVVGPETGPVVARPGGKPLVKVGTEVGLRLVWLMLIAFLGFLVAAMGAKLAGAHRGKRT